MKTNKDSFGLEVMEYLKNGSSVGIIERDDDYIDVDNVSGYFKDFKKWHLFERKAISNVKGKILDVGAGAGRVPLYLQKKGFDVMAIDNSPLAISVCRKRGVKKAKVLPIEDIAKLSPSKFDTIIMFGNNFGLFGNVHKAKRLLKDFYKITTPRALILAESNNPYKTKSDDHHAYQKLNVKRGRMPGQIRIRVRFGKVIGDWFDYLFVSPNEMKMILEGTGWRIRKIIDSGKASYIALIEKI